MDYSSKNTTADEKKRGDGAASKISAGTSSKITSSSSYSSTDASKVSTGGSTSSSSSSSKITKPNSLVEDVWSQLVNQGSNPTTNGGNDNEKDGSENKIFTADSKETFLLFVGSKSSGKSTLINKFLSPNKKDKPKPTVAMEYTFGRRSSSGSGKDIAHIWELGGGKKLSDLVSVPIDPERLSSLVGIIVLDLSIPSKALQSALWWVDLIQTRVRTCLDKLRGTRPGQRTADQILQKSRERLPTNHRDVNDIDVCPIPLVIVANKYDLFANEDPAKRRVLMSALRFIAHTSGASLYCTSSRDKTLSAHYRSMMNNA
jgi:dynein light intermediate chain 2, cytosolic